MRGFFSAFAAILAIVFLMSVVYSNTALVRGNIDRDRVLLAQQFLLKDMFFARNAYQNFASDAILFRMRNRIQTSAATCGAASTTIFPDADFNVQVEQFWNAASDYMRINFDVNCNADLNYQVQLAYEPTAPNAGAVVSNQRTYAMLKCSRTVGTDVVTLETPFVIRKVFTSTLNGANCDLNVFDALGVDSYTPSISVPPYIGRDVNTCVIAATGAPCS